MTDLRASYDAYLACLNARDWDDLGHHVHPDVEHNGQTLGVAGYRSMLEDDVAAIPDLRFDVELLVVQAPRLAARLTFDCTPAGELFGVHVDGSHVRFSENVFYLYRDDKIASVWSVVDRAAVWEQMG
ncbi:MAG: ester cyclase [Nocardioidaceae bacterium]|nr:ester cyclase [Nocardioidaceae bacterium]